MDDKQEQGGWDYNPGGKTAVAERPAPAAAGGSAKPPANSSISWVASEYIEHQRGAGWYLVLIFATVAVAGVAYFLSKDYFAAGIIVVLGIIVAIAVGRKPRDIEYQLTGQGIQVGAKPYTYSQFRCFSIILEGTISSVEFIPIKKFMIPVSAYFGPGDEERIIDIIGQHLPYEERKMDTIDKLSRRLRF